MNNWLIKIRKTLYGVGIGETIRLNRQLSLTPESIEEVLVCEEVVIDINEEEKVVGFNQEGDSYIVKFKSASYNGIVHRIYCQNRKE